MAVRESDQLLLDLAKLDRQELIDRLLHFKGSFNFDLTEEFLEDISEDRLRHILWAAELYACNRSADPVGHAH